MSFEPGGVWTYADLTAAPEYLAGGACKQLVDLGNDASSCMEPAAAPPAAQQPCTTDEFNRQLAALAQACDWPEVISPDPTVIVDRIPSPTSSPPFAFVAGATQHEMGHAFGLDHHCAPAADSSGTVTVLPPDQSDNTMTSAYEPA